MGWNLVWPTLFFLLFDLVIIILDERYIFIPNTSSMYVRVLYGASLDKIRFEHNL